ncbi:MAG: hypothetical protein HOO66_03110, partial [Nitrosarchaeum sp.]|nr:hypothetical protein [Nitrosarchaeum sp.]
ESINATSTESINATSTESINATSTESINATSTEISPSTMITSDALLDLNFDTENTNQTNSTTLQLDGNDDFITIQNNSTDVLSTFTISGWIKPDYSSGSNEFTIISKENSFILSMNNNIEPEHIAKFSIFDGIKWTYVESNSTIQEQWTHISTTFDGNYIKIYINGKLEAITELADTVAVSVDGKLVETQVDTIYSDHDIVIGAYASTNNGSPQLQNKFSGEIDDISLHNSIFDEQTLNQIYQEQFDYYSSLGVDLSLEEIMQQIIQENALATNSTDVNPTNSTVTQLDLVHETIEIGKSVMWTQTIELSNKTDGITVELPEDAEITQVTTMEQQIQETLYNAEDQSKILSDSMQSEHSEMKFKGIMDNADIKENQINNLRIENSTDPEQYDTLVAYLDEIPEQIQQDKPTKLLVVNNTADQLEIKFETPAPYVLEEEHSTNSLYNKTVTVAHDSTLHYTNVISYSTIPEDLVSQGITFDLFWSINSTKMNVTSDPRFAVQFIDTDDNGIIDQMQWIVPQMSEQEFEILANIVIINVQSYPEVGGTWEVRFTTNGTADLVISAINGTTFGESLPDDLNLLSIKCGEDTIQHQWVNGSIVIQNYTCNETGYETSQVLTPGKHHLEFRFGNSIGYANNNAFFVSSFSANLPLGITTSDNGDFLITHVNYDRVANVTSGGSENWNSTGSSLSGPTGIAVNSTGYIYVADTGMDRIQILDKFGAFSSNFGTQGSGNGQFLTPMGIAIDSSDNIYVADTGNDRITKHNKDGSFIEAYGTGFGSGNTQFSGPTGIAVNSTSYIYVADTGNDRIKILTPLGAFSSNFGTQGSGNGQFLTPMGIAIDSSDNIYVADTGNDRITKHNKDGSFIEAFGSFGTGDANFDGPTGVFIFNTDNIYTADTGNDKIKKHDPGIRSLSESLSLSDVVSVVKSGSISLTESLPLDATATTAGAISISLTESLPLDSTATTINAKSVSLTESLPLVATATTAGAISISLTESLPLVATATTAGAISISLTESLPLDSTATTINARSISLTESLPLDSTATTINARSISLTESLPLDSTATTINSKSI